MTDLTLGWAVVGKRPGSRDEQSVIAASASPFTAGQLHKLVAQSSPGNPPSPSENGAAALPWVWLANARLHEVPYLCIAVSSWSGTADAFQRAIAHTRYFFLPLEEFLATSMTLTDLYATVAEVQPRLDDRTNPFSHEMVTVPQRTGDVSWTSPLSPSVAAIAAAHVVEQPVALIGGRSLGLGARLAALDSVRELLPGGALRWLTTACWATGSHPIRLFFTDQARGSDLVLPLRGTPPIPSGAAANYCHTLMRLRDRPGHDGVVQHMRKFVKVQDKDFTAIQSALNELDLVAILEEAARNGTLVLADAQKLQTHGTFVLTETQKVLILGAYLAKATAADIREGHLLLTGNWTDLLGQHLAQAVAAGLNERGWTADGLEALADVAETVNACQHFLAGLRPRSTKRTTTEMHVVWTTVLNLAQRTRWQPDLAEFVANQADLALRAAKLLRTTPRPPNPFYAALNGTGEQTPWTRLCRIYWPEMTTAQATEADVALLIGIDEEAIPQLLRDQVMPLDKLLPALLSYLDHKRNLLWRYAWEDALRGLRGLDTVHEAQLDFVLYRAGRQPVHPLPHVPEYVDALVARTIEAGISLSERSTLVEQAAKTLPPDWHSDPATFESIMDTLWRLGTAPDGADQSVPPLLVDLIKRELRKRPTLLDGEGLQDWAEYFRRLGVLQDNQTTNSFDRLTSTTPLEAVVELIANMVTARQPPKVTNMVAELRRSQWRPPPDEWAYLVLALQFHLRQLNYTGFDKYCGQLMEELVKVVGDRNLTDLANAMASYAQTMATGLKAVDKQYRLSIEANDPEVSELIKTVNSLTQKPSKLERALHVFKPKPDEPAEDEAPTAQMTASELGFQYTDPHQPHGR